MAELETAEDMAAYLAAGRSDYAGYKPAIATCGACGRSWDDAKLTTYTPAPSARCPFESWHEEPDDEAEDDMECALAKRVLVLEAALRKIMQWHGVAPCDKGSNGARDFMRQLAANALAQSYVLADSDS